MSHTLGERVEFYASRSTLRLLQSLAFMMWCIGWGFDKAGPALLSWAGRLKAYAVERINKQDGISGPEVSQSRIKDAPDPEAQPGNGESEKIQINPLSTETGLQRNDPEVSHPRTEDVAENGSVVVEVPAGNMASHVYEMTNEKEYHSSDEYGSMPSPAEGAPDG